MDAQRVSSNDIKVGDTLPWDVIDDKGLLLLKKGSVITTARQRIMLIERGIRLDTPASAAEKIASSSEFNPFDVIEHCAFRLGNLLYKLTQHENMGDVATRIAQNIMAACIKDPDATIGAVHLLHGHAYTTIHPIHTAALCYPLCAALKLSAVETQTIIIAALVSNIGMLELQETLHHQTDPLSDEQKKQIAAHPETSVALLKDSGFNNQALFDIVLQHHERSNGEGYPAGLMSDDISTGAKMLALADVYSAMISPRSYQETMQASDALKTLFLERGKEYDEKLAVLLIKHMGVYPPGSLVQLANNEIAVVVRRSGDNMYPEIAGVVNPRGMPYNRPLSRDPKDSQYAIKGIVNHKWQHTISLSAIWGYE